MKYLKKYKIFESEIIPKDMVNDIIDILVELEDEGRIKTSINLTNVSFYLSDHMDYDGFLFDEISYYVFRLKRYLGDNFKYSSVIFKDPNKNKKNRGRYTASNYFFNRVTINLNSEEDLIKKLKSEPIENLIIEIK